MEYDQITVQQHGAVRTATLNRPERMNTLTGRMTRELTYLFNDTAADDATNALVLTGSGRAFCAGADLATDDGVTSGADGSAPNRQERLDPLASVGRMILALRGMEKPVIAAVNGVAAGAGFGLMTACDLRLASSDARFSTIFIRRGLAPDCGSSYFLPRIVGMSRATEMFLTGEMLNAEAALQAGLVSRVVPPERLMKESLTLAETLASGPPLAIQLTQRALARSLQNTLEEQLILEWAGQMTCSASEDTREGINAFLEKRAPVWKGR